MKIESYKNLIFWQKVMDLAIVIYRITASFPREKIYGLSSQIKRAVILIASNIAKRNRRKKPKSTHYQLLTTNYSLPTSAGFTLVETMVVSLMFSVVMILMGGVLVSSLDLQRRAFNIQQAEENVSFILESMAKEIRVSQITSPDTSCPAAPVTTLSIIHPVNGSIIYSLSGSAVHRNYLGIDTIISSNTVQFTRLQFCISGTPIDNQQQPRVTVIGSLRSAKTKQQATIDFQTTLSQRFLSN